MARPHFHPQPPRWSILFILAPGQPSTTQRSSSKATTEVQANRQEEEGLSKAGWLPPSLPPHCELGSLPRHQPLPGAPAREPSAPLAGQPGPPALFSCSASPECGPCWLGMMGVISQPISRTAVYQKLHNAHPDKHLPAESSPSHKRPGHFLFPFPRNPQPHSSLCCWCASHRNATENWAGPAEGRQASL